MDRDNNRGMRDWLIFIRTAESGSLTETARQLDVSTAAVSKAVSRIEQYLGCVLFTRTRAGMSLTEAGETALRHAKDITSSFSILLEEIRNPQNEIRGTIRLTAPAIVCEFLANEWVYDYSQAHPGVKVFLDARERADLNRDSPELDDLVLRSGRIESDDLVHRKLSPLKLVLCASPEYLSCHPPIRHPRDLKNHNLFGMHHHGLSGPLMLFSEEESFLLEQFSDTGISSNNLFALLNLAIQGKGISLATPGWLASGYLKQGQLQTILCDWEIPDLPAWLIWRPRAHQTRLFSDFRDYIEMCWNSRPQISSPEIQPKSIQPDFLDKQPGNTF
ncbi:LysR family transcriptional regulator [Pantoea stewartii]|uniref:LysR family transcriptional regulator n=1 Tax=Pantoea stewartii TaxID=66269 RepID=UPI0023F645EF|nr:LysR family transcriptional regulator [Pantoea stewartii]MDF7788602.1 LysR family transcriptional regulator [Pantoea stewartii]